MRAETATVADEEHKSEMLYKICDKTTHEAVEMLRIVNPSKYETARERLFRHFEQSRQMINYELYRQLVSGMSTEPNVLVHRKNDLYDLEDVDGDDI